MAYQGENYKNVIAQKLFHMIRIITQWKYSTITLVKMYID